MNNLKTNENKNFKQGAKYKVSKRNVKQQGNVLPYYND